MGTARLPKGKIRVLVADREGIFRLGLKKLFAVEDDLRVVGGSGKRRGSGGAGGNLPA